jgi:hypothetical protein
MNVVTSVANTWNVIRHWQIREESISIMQKIASCGNDCFVCPRYIATQSGDVIRLKEVAELWNRLGWRDTVVSPEEIMCYGCSSSNFCRYGIQRCASEREVDNCGNCKDYPCNLTIRSFGQTKIYAESIKEKCTEEEYQSLKVAFSSKKENLDEVRNKRLEFK